jgi:ElaB/YqjD/DUF883 family membrane-anchored ribosome-binding protein
METAMLMQSRKRSGSAQELAEIGRLLRDLERHFEKLGRSAVADARHAGSVLPEAISETWSDLSDRVGVALQERARSVGKEATRAGTKAWHRVEREVGYHPLAALAIAAGIGFLIGALNRR